MNKAELLDWLQAQQQQWQAFLDQIGRERMEQPGVAGDWSIKDIVAHLSDWQPWMLSRLQAAQRGEPAPTPPWPAQLQTDDEINAWIYETNRERSLGEVLDRSQQGFQQLVAAVEGLPDDVRIETIRSGDREYHVVWLNDQRFAPGEFFDHFHDDHEPEMRAWLGRQA
ncbi:MAG: ClbS/DfsB family four-helix bundle protein [Chloroflexi bacterium]|nr:ClbS/DfsB family four-helix bundle protein [Chloroflexota bacterium]